VDGFIHPTPLGIVVDIDRKLTMAGVMAWIFALAANIVITKYYTLAWLCIALVLLPWFCCVLYVLFNNRNNFLKYAWVYLSVLLATAELLLRVMLYLSWKNGFAP
jgi:hypothetical protein